MCSPSERVGKNHGFSGTSNTKRKSAKNALFSLKMAIDIWNLVKFGGKKIQIEKKFENI